MTRGIPQVTRASRLIALPVLLLVFGFMTSHADVAHAEAAAAQGTLDLGLLEVDALSRDPGAWAILDARPHAAFVEGHLPGAHSFSWEDHTRTDERGIPFQPWPPSELAAALGAMGITETTPVVVYGDADKSWGGEGWTCWALEWLGHRGPVRLLTGGIEAWRVHDPDLETSAPRMPPQPSAYHPALRTDVNVDTADLRRRIDSFSIVDTRSDAEWLLGTIPGAVHIPWEEFYQGGDRRPLPPEALKALLVARGVSVERPVVYYCAGGVRSAYAWLVHDLSGLPPALNYEGGMEEWKRTK